MKLTREVAGKLAAYFRDKLDVKPHRTGWLRQGTCPSCGKEKKFGVNPLFDRTNCFSCGYHPKPLDLLMHLEGFSTWMEAHTYLKSFEGTEYRDSPVDFIKEKEVSLPESYTLIILGDSTLANLARNYLKKRGYKNLTALAMKGVGYCTTGDFAGRIIIPYYRAGRLIYYNARQFVKIGPGGPHKNPGMDLTGLGKSMVMYNSDALYIYDSCYLVESATNALTLGDRAFSTGGKILSNYQISDIIKSPCQRITIILDPDAQWEALKTGLDLARHKKVRMVFLPKKKKPGSEKYLDANDYGKKKTLEFVRASKYMTYEEIYRRFIVEPKPLHYLPEV